MNKNLYFIPVLSQALLETDLDRSLAKAFTEIKQRGLESQFKEGFRSFEAFMAIAHSYHEEKHAANGLDLEAWASPDQDDAFPEIGLFREDQLVSIQCIDSLSGHLSFVNICPGYYQAVLLNTGWVIWSRELEARDVIISEAQGTENLKMAADTGGTEPQEVPETVPLDGNLILRIVPGIESGTVEIECLG